MIYAIPSNANDILCIDTNPLVSTMTDTYNQRVSFLGEDAAFRIGNVYNMTQTKRKDKWQGTKYMHKLHGLL